MKRINLISTCLLSMAFILSSCTSTKTVTRVEEDAVIDLSGRWNETDARLVANEMVTDMLSRPWLEEFVEAHAERPVIVVGLIENKTHEHIETETYIKNIEREILNSGKVRLVTAGAKREDLRRERADQNEFASKETAKNWGKELGADFILQGTMTSIVDSNPKTKVVFYQTNLELTNVETNEIVWIGEKQIKKVVE